MQIGPFGSEPSNCPAPREYDAILETPHMISLFFFSDWMWIFEVGDVYVTMII